MKNFLLLTTAILLATNISSACAEENNFEKTYAGIDLQRTVYDYNVEQYVDGGTTYYLDDDVLLEDALNGINIYAGQKFNKNFGIEAGFFYNDEESKNTPSGSTVGSGTVSTADINTKLKSYGLTLDAIGYMPINDKFELLGSIGAAYTRADYTLATSVSTAEKSHDTEMELRLGAGGQIHLTEKIDARAMARYQTADFDDVADNAWVYSLGINYGF
jgi:opacity protein-like surface antigen